MGNETHSQTPEQSSEFDILFTKFSYLDVIKLSDYHKSIFANPDGVADIVSQPISLAFSEKFKDDFRLLEDNTDFYDERMTAEGADIEDIIFDDPIIQALLLDRNKPMHEDDKEKYAKAIKVRRSVLAYLYLDDVRSPQGYEESMESNISDIEDFRKNHLGNAS